MYNLDLSTISNIFFQIRASYIIFHQVSQNGMYLNVFGVDLPCLVYCLQPLQPTNGASLTKTKADTGLPSGWEVRHSNSKNLPYYFNESQKQSRWEPPPGTDTEKLKAYMAEHHSQRELGPDAGGPNGNTNTGKIRASHLLVKHKDSRRPSSWREVG